MNLKNICLIFVAFLLCFTGCEKKSSSDDIPSDAIEFDGTVRYSDVNWYIEADDGTLYRSYLESFLDEEFRIEGLRVHVVGEKVDFVGGIPETGTPIDIISIEVI